MSPKEYTKLIFDVAEILLPAFIRVHKSELDGRSGLYVALLYKGVTYENFWNKIDTKLIGFLPEEKRSEKEMLAKE